MRSLLAARGMHEDVELGIPAPLLEPVRGLEEYFRPWSLLRALPTDPEALRVLALAAAHEFVQDGVAYAELRNSITYIATANSVSTAVAVGWLLEALEYASASTGVDLRLIAGLTRESAHLEHTDRLLSALAVHTSNDRLVGVDISGNEDIPVPASVARFFRAAKEDLGLGVTIHAGETGNIANIWWALTECRADRIGHCLAGAYDDAVLAALSEADVCVEVCLTSNRLTGFVPDLAEHPVVRFHEANVSYVLCTDNPQLHGLPLSGEYQLFTEIMGDPRAVDQMARVQDTYSFARRSR